MASEQFDALAVRGEEVGIPDAGWRFSLPLRDAIEKEYLCRILTPRGPAKGCYKSYTTFP
ncbi:MAG: hypothetical protein ACR2MN_14020 [Acidimicrobiales bacterium]